MARILLAEPDRAIREFIAGILTEFGHDVQNCVNIVDADVWLATARFDVLVTDMVLRGSPGSALSRRLAILGIPTVTLSGQEIRAEDGAQKTSPTLLEKPFRFSDLRRVVSAVEAQRPAKAPRRDVGNAA